MAKLKAPKGKVRVICVDLFSHEDCVVGDYATEDDAFKIADESNQGRTGSMDDVCYVYDDQGKYLGGHERIPGGHGISP